MSIDGTTTRSTTTGNNRSARLQAICDGARVREALGQGAHHRRLNGQHEIIFGGQRFVASMLDAAIEAAGGNTL